MDGLVVLLIYGLIFAVVIALGVLFFARSLLSRKRYRCPQCGEEFRVELMEASHCSHCGAPVKMKEYPDAESR